MKKIFAANWKLFKNPQETRNFFDVFKESFNKSEPEVVFFPSAVCLESTSHSLKGSSILWGAQNVYSNNQGAFTGENSAQVIKDLGGSYILVGHSERRSIFGEQNKLFADKIENIQKLDMVPMYCIGETLQEREKNLTEKVLQTQLEEGLAKADKTKPIVIAYEPVWAIGTGKVASPEQVAQVHQWIHHWLEKNNYKQVPVLYGGSVKPDNASGLISQPGVNGFLVGGASLEVDSFLKICSV